MPKVCNICICVNHQEYRDASVNETRTRLTIILKVKEDFIFKVKNFTLRKAMLKSIENYNFHMIIRTIYAKF